MREPLVGIHTSIAGGLYKALLRGASHGCRTVQIFTSSNMSWHTRNPTDRDVQRFNRAREESGIRPVVAHDSYLINLSSVNELTRQRSLAALAGELARCARLALPTLVMHPGAHGGLGAEEGIARIAGGLDEAIERSGVDRVRILLETTAGSGSVLGHCFEQLAGIIAKSKHSNRLGVCLDTAHTFAAGYDLRTRASYREVWREFDRTIGLDRLGCFHFNDSKAEFRSRVDRHEHIGKGRLGLEPFRFILNDERFRDIPKILETPKGTYRRRQWDDINLQTLRSLVAK